MGNLCRASSQQNAQWNPQKHLILGGIHAVAIFHCLKYTQYLFTKLLNYKILTSRYAPTSIDVIREIITHEFFLSTWCVPRRISYISGVVSGESSHNARTRSGEFVHRFFQSHFVSPFVYIFFHLTKGDKITILEQTLRIHPRKSSSFFQSSSYDSELKHTTS
jgi:hypothetical protein